MALRYDTISFLSDYGRTDEFVGVVHSVIRQLCPEVTVIDVTHDIPPFDVRAGGLPGQVQAVPVPGVISVDLASARPARVAASRGRCRAGRPGNGLSHPRAMLAARCVVWLNDLEHHLVAGSPSTADVFAFVAVRTAAGRWPRDLGGDRPGRAPPGLFPSRRPRRTAARTSWVDCYGNVS